MILHFLALIGGVVLWLVGNGSFLIWRLQSIDVTSKKIPLLGVEPDVACFCEKVFMPKLDLPNTDGWKAAWDLFVVIGVLTPLYVPQELIRRWIHQKRCLAWQIRRMDRKKDETR